VLSSQCCVECWAISAVEGLNGPAFIPHYCSATCSVTGWQAQLVTAEGWMPNSVLLVSTHCQSMERAVSALVGCSHVSASRSRESAAFTSWIYRSLQITSILITGLSLTDFMNWDKNLASAYWVPDICLSW